MNSAMQALKDLLRHSRRGGARRRHHVVGIEMLAEFGVRGELCVADTEIGVWPPWTIPTGKLAARN